MLGVDSVVLVSALPVLVGHCHPHRHLSRPLLHSTQAVQRLHSAHSREFTLPAYHFDPDAVIERYLAVHISDCEQKKILRTCVSQT
jgi:hypothetical protein